MDLANAKSSLLLLKSIFDKHGLRFFLHGGTLLGVIREKDFISYDYDIDICIFKTDLDKYVETLPDLEKVGFHDVRGILPSILEVLEQNDNNLAVKRGDVQIDVFVAKWYDEEDCLGYGDKSKGNRWYRRFPKKCCEGFDTVSFLGEDFLIPKNAEEFLLYLYGKDWRIPTRWR